MSNLTIARIPATPRYTVRDIVPSTWRLVHIGKVRETYEVDGDPDYYHMVCTDRLSAFDVVSSQPIPGKGVVLNLMSAFWFGKARNDVATHFVRVLKGDGDYHPDLAWRTSIVRRVAPVLKIEAIFRNLLTGSALIEYRKKGTVCGMRVRKGMVEGDQFTNPIYTPSTKADSGHDQNVHPSRVPGILKEMHSIPTYKGVRLSAAIRRIGLELVEGCTRYASQRGINIADTKMEFGLTPGWESTPVFGVHRHLILVDEFFTPDSSRFWPVDYQPGTSPPSYDKQFVRDFLSRLGWDRTPPMPTLPDEVVVQTTSKYIEALSRLTDIELVLV